MQDYSTTLSYDSELHAHSGPTNPGPPGLPPGYLAGVRALWRHRLHLVLIDPSDPDSKKPLWTGHLERRAGLDGHIVPHVEAGHHIGWVLRDYCALDVDIGDVWDLAWELAVLGSPPLGVVPSRRPGRGHLIYDDPGGTAAGLAGRKWAFRDWGGGDIVAGPRDYAVIWGPEALLEALEASQMGASAPPPLDLLEILAEDTPPEAGQAGPGTAVDLDAAIEALDPTQAWPGNRNNWLWGNARRWAYRQRWWDLNFEDRLATYLDRAYALIPDTEAQGGFPRSEASKIGRSILPWCRATLEPWEGRRRAAMDSESASDGDSEDWEAGAKERSQQAREDGVRSGEARRARTAERDQKILQLRAEGWSLGHIGEHVGLTRQGVAWVCKRGVPGLSSEPLKSPPQAKPGGVGGGSFCPSLGGEEVVVGCGGGGVGAGSAGDVLGPAVLESVPGSLRGGVSAPARGVVGGEGECLPACPSCPGRHRPDTWCHSRRLCPCLDCTTARWVTMPSRRSVFPRPSRTGGRCPVCEAPGVPDRRCRRCGRSVQAVPVSSPVARAARSPRRPRDRQGRAHAPAQRGAAVTTQLEQRIPEEPCS